MQVVMYELDILCVEAKVGFVGAVVASGFRRKLRPIEMTDPLLMVRVDRDGITGIQFGWVATSGIYPPLPPI
jgi:hypothetical protein